MADLSLTPEIGQWRKVLPFWVSYLLLLLIWAMGFMSMSCRAIHEMRHIGRPIGC